MATWIWKINFYLIILKLIKEINKIKVLQMVVVFIILGFIVKKLEKWYIIYSMIFDWNNEKNIMLKRDRNISFERIIIAIEQDSLLDILEHPNKEKYPNQFLILVEIDRYVYVVPCVLENDVCFLKTIFPSRKYTSKYLDWKGEENE